LPSPKRPSGQIVVPPFGGIRGTGISHTLAPVRRELGWRDRAVDGALALGAAVANVLAVTFPDKTVAYDFAGGGPLHVGVVAFTGLILWWRRSAPGRVFVLCTLAVTGVTLAHWDPGLLPLNYAVATFSLGAHATIRDGLRGVALGIATMGWMVVAGAPYFDSWLAVGAPAQLIAAWALGATMRAGHRRAEAAEAHRHELEHDGAITTERAVLEDRLRVARDLHDSVSGALCVITIQASAARANDPRGTSGPLADIERTTRTAMSELREMVSALRGAGSDSPTNAEDEALRASLARATGWQPTTASVSEAPRAVITSLDWPVDVTLGLALVALNVTGSLVEDDSTTVTYVQAPLSAIVLLASLPGLSLILRRRHAVAALAVVVSCLMIITGLGWPVGNLPGTLLVATFAVGAWTSPRVGGVAIVTLNAVLVVLVVAAGPRFAVWAAPVSPVVFTLPWILGGVLRRKRLRGERAIAAAQAAEVSLARDTERAIADGRLAVARDLHDLVSHNLAAVVVQASMARHAMGADRTLEVIEDTSRAAMMDLRRMLTALSTAAPEMPAPGLDELEALVAAHSATHGPVDLSVDALVASEAASLRLTVYRIVQEALTNVGRHAPGAKAVVDVSCTDNQVVVRVEDDGRVRRRPRTGGGGFGLAGMRERVALAGGTFSTGPTRVGGFQVEAKLVRSPVELDPSRAHEAAR